MTPTKKLRVAVVGPCASGKSTLIAALAAAGFDARHVAQEHSYVKDMWQRRTNPDFLVYLDIDEAASLARRPHQIDGLAWRLTQQNERLRHAREHADVYIDTSAVSAEIVQQTVLNKLNMLAN